MSDKLKISFDIDNTWQWEVFRELVNQLLIEDELFDIYLITQNTDTQYVNTIVTNMQIDANNVFQEISDAAIITRLNVEKIDIYLTASQPVVLLAETSTKPTIGILVNSIIDRYKKQPAYITSLEFWINQLTEDATNNAC